MRLIIAAVGVLVAGVQQAMDRFDIKTDWKWARNNWGIFLTTATALVLVFVSTMGDVIAQRRALRGQASRVGIHKP